MSTSGSWPTARDPEFAAAQRDVERSNPIDFFDRMIDFGVGTGEVDERDRPVVASLFHTITVGLTDAVSGDPCRHRQAVDDIGRLLTGDLVKPV